MAWVESHQELGNHPKLARFRRTLGISKVEAVGHLHYLWWWALDYAKDGRIGRYQPEEIADAALWEGDCGAFWDALITAEFVDEDGNLHDWYDYAGRLMERRDANAKRMRDARSRESLPIKSARAEHVPRTCIESAGLPDLTGPDRTGPVSSPLYSPPLPPGIAHAVHVERMDAAASMATAVDKPSLRELSVGAREVLQAYRQAFGKRAPPKLNPTQAEMLEEAVVDLGPERLTEAVQWAASAGVTELVKIVRGAKTKRQHDEAGTVMPVPLARRNGTVARRPGDHL